MIQGGIVSAWIATTYAQENAAAVQAQWRTVASNLCPKRPQVATLLDSVNEDVLTSLHFFRRAPTKLHSANSIPRLNDEIKWRSDVVSKFLNEATVVRLVGATLLEQSDE